MSEDEKGFPRLEVKRKTGNERFHRNGKPFAQSLLEFWRWSASDLVSNATRGILAEYIVAHALGIVDGVRAEWGAFDLLTESGVKIEIKSSAYLQTWHHENLSTINFSIRPTKLWDGETNKFSTELKRQADIYVFCVLNHRNKDSLDPLNLEQWDFYVLRASALDENHPRQQSIRLSSLLKLNPCVAKYDEIAGCVERLSGES